MESCPTSTVDSKLWYKASARSSLAASLSDSIYSVILRGNYSLLHAHFPHRLRPTLPLALPFRDDLGVFRGRKGHGH